MKFIQTLRIALNLVLARTFGTYEHSIGGGAWPYGAIYIWRGRRWFIPLKDQPHDQ